MWTLLTEILAFPHNDGEQTPHWGFTSTKQVETLGGSLTEISFLRWDIYILDSPANGIYCFHWRNCINDKSPLKKPIGEVKPFQNQDLVLSLHKQKLSSYAQALLSAGAADILRHFQTYLFLYITLEKTTHQFGCLPSFLFQNNTNEKCSHRHFPSISQLVSLDRNLQWTQSTVLGQKTSIWSEHLS